MGVKSTKINIMRKITQEEYDSFEMVNGIKICPSGDYSDINEFEELSLFGND